MEDADIRARLKPGSAYADLPGQHVTINQIVAWNLTYFRRAAGLTQQELGERLGWSKAIVSAAERSWDGKRVRHFSADDIVTIAAALRLPLAAMFLPPDDDGVNRRYLIDLPAGEGCYGMRELMIHVVSDPAEGAGDEDAEDDGDAEGSAVRMRYWSRYVAAINSYLRADRVGGLADFIDDIGTEERMVEHLERLRGQYDALRQMISDNDHLQAALTDRLLAARGGRGIAGEDRRTPERREWDMRVAEIARELFGGAGLTRDQIETAVTEAVKRGFVEPPRGRWFEPDGSGEQQ